jgi:parallel beta-helix repeat protein
MLIRSRDPMIRPSETAREGELMRKKGFVVIALLSVLLVSIPGARASEGHHPPRGTHPACDTAVDQSIRLTADVGSKIAPCTSWGLRVARNGITIDLGGHTIWGNPPSTDFRAGVFVNGQHHIRIINGTVRGFTDDVSVYGNPVGTVVSKILATGAKESGIYVSGSRARVDHNVAVGNLQNGILFGARGNVEDNIASDNGLSGISFALGSAGEVAHNNTHGNGKDGVEMVAPGTLFKNTAEGNLQDGFEVKGDGAIVRHNRALGNDTAGIVLSGTGQLIIQNVANGNGWGTADGNGLGIDASAATAPKTSPKGPKNVAHGNDDVDECDPASLCG